MTWRRIATALLAMGLAISPAIPAYAQYRAESRAETLAETLAESGAPHGAKTGLVWESWSKDLFTRAKAENKFVILDLEAVWCHWCHVMEETTYNDPKVIDLLKSKYITVRVDQDANPDLSNRYGNWGWPATIVFAADGTEIVKRRGYIPPERMAFLLQAILDDPSPGPSAFVQEDVVPAAMALLAPEQRRDLERRSQDAYDVKFGGWGEFNKFIDAESMDLLLISAAGGDPAARKKVEQTLDAALHLIDRAGDGIYQYSDAVDWKSPHYEKIMFYQAHGVRQYAEAYALWKRPSDLAAAADIARYLTTTLMSPDGAFYTSQDADIDAANPGKMFYALTRSEREKRGRAPRIDTNIYARENGWAISGLVAYANATGDAATLATAERAARWILANRHNSDGSFRHGERDRGGPFLGDTLAMGQAALDLYAATGNREWLAVAEKAGIVIATHFQVKAGGFVSSMTPEGDTGVFVKPVKTLDEQVQATRFAIRLYRYFGAERFRALAEHGVKYLVSDGVLSTPRALPGVLLAEQEFAEEPVHITIVGKKDDRLAQDLHRAARAYPALYKRLDWWDKREGDLPNPDVQYPELEQAAAFACTNKICSLPAFSAEELTITVNRMLALQKISSPE